MPKPPSTHLYQGLDHPLTFNAGQIKGRRLDLVLARVV